MQSEQTQELHWSPPQDGHWHWAWLQVAQLQSAHEQPAQLSEQFAQAQVSHSS